MKSAALLYLSLGAVALFTSACTTGAGEVSATIAPTSQEDFDTRMNACMADKGWIAIEATDGTYSFEVDDGQTDVFLTDNGACLETIVANQEAIKTDDEWRTVYGILVGVHDCLVGQRLDLPLPPSFQAWQDMDRNWGPYGDVPLDVMEERSVELEAACPRPTIW